jgi:hypothetical protein
LCCVGTGAGAQEITVLYGIRSNGPVDRIPVNPPYHYRIAPRAEPAGPAPRIIEITPGETSAASTPALRGARGNPLADLLSDPTLRAGDIAMFADGPRVFTGASYGSRALSDFAPVASAPRLLPGSLRHYVLSLRPASTEEWAAPEPAPPARAGQPSAAQRGTGFEVVRVSPR